MVPDSRCSIQHMNCSCLGKIWSCPHNSKIAFALEHAGFLSETFNEKACIMKKAGENETVISFYCFFCTFQPAPASPSVSVLAFVTSRWHCSQVSGYTASNFTCQLWLPKKKVQMYLFHPSSEGFFCCCVQGQMQCVWHRERISITNMLTGCWPMVPSSLSTQWRSPF